MIMNLINGEKNRENLNNTLSKPPKHTSNLQKAGAASEDVKILLKHWHNNIPQKELIKELISENVLGKKSRKRTSDVIRYIFLPRYVNGYPKNHWGVLEQLTEADVSIEILRPILYFHCALNEPLIGDFIDGVLLPRYMKGILEVDSKDVSDFIKKNIQSKNIPVKWGDSVIKRVASGLFSALTEFGVLEGKRKRKIVPRFFPLCVFFYIAFFISKEGFLGKGIIEHSYWRLFLLNPQEIEHLFMEAHQEKYLRYEQIGEIIRIEFFQDTFEEIVNVIIERGS